MNIPEVKPFEKLNVVPEYEVKKESFNTPVKVVEQPKVRYKLPDVKVAIP